MKHLMTTLITTTALITAAPVSAEENNTSQFCETAFYPGDQDDDGQLTKDEIAMQRDKQFKEIDINDDGSISRDEMVNCVGQTREGKQAKIDAFSGGSAEYDVGQWSDLKLHQKEELSAEEFAELSKQAWESGDAKMQRAMSYDKDTKSQESFAASAVERFQMHDTNGDGVLSKSEYETPARADRWSDEEINKRFDEMDADGSGEISPPEYRGAGTWAIDETKGSENNSDTDDKIDVQTYYILLM